MDWSVGQVEEVFDRGGTPRAWGFEIMGKQRRPLLLFSYASELDALVAPPHSRSARKSGVRWRAGSQVIRCLWDRVSRRS